LVFVRDDVLKTGHVIEKPCASSDLHVFDVPPMVRREAGDMIEEPDVAASYTPDPFAGFLGRNPGLTRRVVIERRENMLPTVAPVKHGLSCP